MKYNTLILKNNLKLINNNFLSKDAKDLLSGVDCNLQKHVLYNNERGKHYVSLATPVNEILIKKMEQIKTTLRGNDIYAILIKEFKTFRTNCLQYSS